MILCDAGPLIALIDASEADNHHRCKAVLPNLRGPLVTTWACFTEAMYFLGDRGGLPLQRMLWRFVDTGKLRLYSHAEAETSRMKQLMDTYHDTPMDFPDASLVAAAESLNVTQIFTLDTHFYAYRINAKTPFDVFPDLS